MRKLLILMLLGVLFVPMNGSAKADEVLYCQSEVATGLYKENGTWKEGGFERKRFTVKVIVDFEAVMFRDNLLSCSVPFSRYPKELVCHNKDGLTFVYSQSSRRFVYSYVNTATYLDADTPVLFAGTCEKF